MYILSGETINTTKYNENLQVSICDYKVLMGSSRQPEDLCGHREMSAAGTLKSYRLVSPIYIIISST